MNEQTTSARYCLYARKSTESDERQTMSIDSQIKEMSALAEKEGLSIKDIRRESFSAKTSGTREVFNRLLLDIYDGKFNGIFTWAPDRLSRNADDLGRLVDLMDQNKLQTIRTFSQTFTNNPNEKFLLMILCSQAKLENDNRGINVKRGIRAKCEMGWRPNKPPLGYFGRSFGGKKDVIIDSERAPIIKEMYERVAKKGESGRTLKRWIDGTSFRSRDGKKVSLSQIYLTLKNPYYYGEFEYPKNSGTWYKGSHTPLISRKIFNAVQQQLVTSDKGEWGQKEFPFKGILRCGGCGGGVTAEEKFKKLKYGGFNRHVYYHCTRSKDYDCKEPYISDKELIEQLVEIFDRIEISPGKINQQLQEQLEQYQRLRADILRQEYLQGKYDKFDYDKNVDIGMIREYVKHALTNGILREQKSVLSLLPHQLYLRNRHFLLRV